MAKKIILIGSLIFVCCFLGFSFQKKVRANEETKNNQIALLSENNSSSKFEYENALLKKGEYLATIGVCNACHTPPNVPQDPKSVASIDFLDEVNKRVDADWMKYLDHDNEMAGGVPFIIRMNAEMGGVVYSRNITPDIETGIGNWTDQEIEKVLRTGTRKDGTNLFLFAPHTFFKSLAEDDMKALIAYLKNLKPVKFKVPERELPFEPVPSPKVDYLTKAPEGRNTNRAEYLTSSLIGCAECHSHTGKDGELHHFIGGDPMDSHLGVFRLGPDLPLRPMEKGFAAFPYTGYAVLYGGNLTRFGKGGDLDHVSAEGLVHAIQNGISTRPDEYGRPRSLSHVMLWQYYKKMKDEDVYAIADYIKQLDYIEHDIGPNLYNYGDNWELAFEKAFGEKPSKNDRKIFGKN